MITTRELQPDELDVLFDLPHRIYANDPAWVAPIPPLEKRRIMGFIRQDRLKLYVAEMDGVPVGTMSAMIDEGYNANKGERVAWFGYYETIDDPQITAKLFANVQEQARAWNCTRIRGPRNLTRFECMGITVEGHDTLPPFMQAQHARWYAAHIEALGLVKHHDVLAYETPVLDALGNQRELTPELKAKSEGCTVPDLVVRPASRMHMGRDLRDAHTVLNEAFATVPDISPMPLSQWMALGRTYLMVADPQLLQIAYSGDRPVAFSATFPELNEAFKAMDGHVLPLGWLRTALAAQTIHTASFKLIGVVPDLRGTGLHARLIDHTIQGVKAAGYTRLEASVIDERNTPMRTVVEHAGMTIYRRYRVYQTETGS